MTLIGYWPLNETSGSTAYDYAGVIGNGTNNSATVGQTGLLRGNAYQFASASNSYVSLPSYSLGTEYTVSAWVNLDVDEDYNDIFGSESNLTLISYVDGTIKSYVGDGGSWSTNLATSTGVTTPGSWQLWTLTATSGSRKLYVDSEMKATDSSTQSVGSTVYHIGARNGQDTTYSLNGRLCEVRVYNHPLTPSEIRYLYNTTKNGNLETRKKTA